jgi:hypothetical protein
MNAAPARRGRIRSVMWLGGIAAGAMGVAVAYASMSEKGDGPAAVSFQQDDFDSEILENARRMMREGKQTFRYDTFGSQAFWGGKLRLHEAIAGAALGGVGPGVSPKAALELGLKVDVEALPVTLVGQIRNGQVNLADPATTLALLQLNAVVGVTGYFSPAGRLESLGIQCALCHSTVDDSFSPGIGRRLDGWANRDLNIGAIVASAPNLQPFAELLGVNEGTVRRVLSSWGPGRYDAELNVDGKAFRPDGRPAATMIPSAFGLAGVNQHTWTGGWGTVTYWNAYVANLQMRGQGTFIDARLEDAEQYPVAARAGFGHKRDNPDLITAKLPALHFYQLAMPAPKAPPGSFDPFAARQGEVIFNGKAKCAECHVPPLFTEPGYNLHTAKEIGIDDFQAERGPERRYVTTPLRALFDTTKLHKGGFYHDGRFPTLDAVVRHYERARHFTLTDIERAALVEYLKSL